MKKIDMPGYASRRFKGKASVVKIVNGTWDGGHALLRAARPIRGWKRVYADEKRLRFLTIELSIPKGTLFWCHSDEGKCRAERVISRGDGISNRGSVKYRRGKVAKPDGFSVRPNDGDLVCAHGIHFFASKSGASRYNWS